MKIDNIKNMKHGWIVGEFDPSVESCSFEVGHHFHAKGAVGQNHYHKLSKEINYVLRGKMMINGKVMTTGQIFVLEPYEISCDVTFLEDTDLVVIRTKSIPGDKYKAE